MAFVSKKESASDNNKQHLNLSALAFEMIRSDMFAFGEEKLSGFINTILEHYGETADASIARMLNLLRDELAQLLENVPGDSKIKQKIICKLVERRQQDLKAKAACYGQGVQLKFWLNAENFRYLTEENSECGEEAFYSTRGKYIKCVIEEYARLPYVEREKIWFKPFVRQVEDAIAAKKRLRIETGAGKIYSFAPYALMTDPLSSMNYLVGYCCRYDIPDGEMRPVSFRLSGLKDIRLEKSRSAGISKDQVRQLEQMIAVRGVQFMAGPEDRIRVRLTENGFRRYRRYLHLRPEAAEQKGDVLTFCCTPAQAEFYFFKFGEDAEILEPVWLREKFIGMYTSALKTYGAEPSGDFSDEA